MVGNQFVLFASAYDIVNRRCLVSESNQLLCILPSFFATWSLYRSLPGGSCGGDPYAYPASVAIYFNPALLPVLRALRHNMAPLPIRVSGADTSTEMSVVQKRK